MRISALCFLCLLPVDVLGASRPPNVLLIVVDDLNDWVGHLGGNPQSSTPPPGASQGVGTIRFGAVDAPDEAMQDEQVVSWVSDRLGRPAAAPFFMACGIYRPAFPAVCAATVFRQFPLQRVRLPETLATGWDDLPAAGPLLRAEFR